MLKLCGFAASNYYNKVKLALLEKGMAFEEVLVWADKSEGLLAKSPYGKIPFLETDAGALSESNAICEYLETIDTRTPLLPADPFAAAKVREIIAFADLYLEWDARRLFPAAFFGAKLDDATRTQVGKQLDKAVVAFHRLVDFAPFAHGNTFTLADCALAVHLPLISLATKIVLQRDVLEGTPAKAYVEMIAQRPSVQRANADRKINTEAMLARAKR